MTIYRWSKTSFWLSIISFIQKILDSINHFFRNGFSVWKVSRRISSFKIWYVLVLLFVSWYYYLWLKLELENNLLRSPIFIISIHLWFHEIIISPMTEILVIISWICTIQMRLRKRVWHNVIVLGILLSLFICVVWVF